MSTSVRVIMEVEVTVGVWGDNTNDPDAYAKRPGIAFRLAEHKVQPPYVNLRLDEDLVGYNSTLRSHERRAMLTRR
jgi:hypothetical protein